MRNWFSRRYISPSFQWKWPQSYLHSNFVLLLQKIQDMKQLLFFVSGNRTLITLIKSLIQKYSLN